MPALNRRSGHGGKVQRDPRSDDPLSALRLERCCSDSRRSPFGLTCRVYFAPDENLRRCGPSSACNANQSPKRPEAAHARLSAVPASQDPMRRASRRRRSGLSVGCQRTRSTGPKLITVGVLPRPRSRRTWLRLRSRMLFQRTARSESKTHQISPSTSHGFGARRASARTTSPWISYFASRRSGQRRFSLRHGIQ